ncbi:LuxR C-terminal-related transcriptional regulator [Actinoplanes sp. NPDC051343]|uniref:LuxR C-terminal-related transcriptional regulator n=1 Tax=Actinoplanes sp. NPDC051343 TaxID=3363906 RepID=UPI0037B5B046
MTDVETTPRLTAIGLSPRQEQAYRYLVTAGETRTAAQIGDAVALGEQDTDHLLRDLESGGLVIRATGRPGSYRASPPEVALGTLVSRRDGELDRIRLLTAELQGQYREAARQRSTDHSIEVVRGTEQINRYYLHLVHGARYGLDVLTKPPYLAGDGLLTTLRAEDAGIRRGVRSRSVYDGDALDEHGTLAIAEQSMEFGEEARATTGLPFKMAIVDGRTGFMPLDVRSPAVGALLVRSPPLLEAMIALFEGIWLRAVPMRAGRAHTGADTLDARAADVLRLMSAGLKDETIARALHLSRRTVQKHVTDVMTALGARTRFQAALLAKDRGWVG